VCQFRSFQVIAKRQSEVFKRLNFYLCFQPNDEYESSEMSEHVSELFCRDMNHFITEEL
jgi:hypothetical protein